MERQELQNRRAVNQIWNGAGRYDVQPEQAAFDEGGDPELYLNTVMGLARRDYDFARFQPMLHAFQQQPSTKRNRPAVRRWRRCGKHTPAVC